MSHGRGFSSRSPFYQTEQASAGKFSSYIDRIHIFKTFRSYIQTFLNPIVVFGVVCPFAMPLLVYLLCCSDGTALDFQPIFYQACKGSSAIRSGVEASGLAMTLGPFLIITGASVAVTKKYRQQLWLGWSLLTIAMGLMSTLHPDTSNVNSIGFLTFVGVGGGIVYSATYFPVLAPLPV